TILLFYITRRRRHTRFSRDWSPDVCSSDLIFLALDGRVGQHPGGLLERRRGQEALGGQRRLGDAQQHRLGRGRLAARLQHPPVLYRKSVVLGNLRQTSTIVLITVQLTLTMC